jgi:ABC-type transport system involved in multi-copper enzyme maturation permease subunit
MMTNWSNYLLFGLLLAAAQLLAAVPWVLLLSWHGFRDWRRRAASGEVLSRAGVALAVLVFAGVVLGGVVGFVNDAERMQFLGRIYGALLHVQLVVDLFILALLILVTVWPKGGNVALAAFKEGLRQPWYWMLTVGFILFLLGSMFVPYFTFGEEVKMVKEIGYDVIMLPALLFAVLTAGQSVSEEIEGRTAITLMSKPLSRRQFLLGKFVGILLGALAMAAILGWVFDWVLWFKPWYEDEPINLPAWADSAKTLLAAWGEPIAAGFHGIALWFAQAVDTLPGLVLGSCQIMVLLAVGVALATRLPMIVTWVSCFLLFWLGHVAPVLVIVAEGMRARSASPSATLQLIAFAANAFNTFVPALEFFNLGPIIARDAPLNPVDYSLYIGSVVLYAVMYTGIALLLGLILFEDRDLA